MKTKITELFGIQHPIVQAGMIWCSGWKLASAVSNSGGLGIIGAGSMYPEILRGKFFGCYRKINDSSKILFDVLHVHVRNLSTVPYMCMLFFYFLYHHTVLDLTKNSVTVFPIYIG